VSYEKGLSTNILEAGRLLFAGIKELTVDAFLFTLELISAGPIYLTG